MNQLIKISNQSAKFLGNYAECKICRFNSNNKLLHARLVPKDISNRYALSDHRATSSLPRQFEPGFHYIQKFYKSHTKIKLLQKETQ